MSKHPYQIGLLGDYQPHQAAIEATVRARFDELGISGEYQIVAGSEVINRDRLAPFAALFFGYAGAATSTATELRDALADSVVVLPIVDDLTSFSAHVPPELRGVNGVAKNPADPGFNAAVGTLLEGFKLLRRDRRLFISYRRDDSSAIANQLYDVLDRRGFDVFLDTRGVPPGEDFQAVLWHRMADSDVVVLLDTPNFLESRWTEAELTKANATNIQVLHVLWPGRPASAPAAFSRFFSLANGSFQSHDQGKNGLLQDTIADLIAVEVEGLRARAIAARHRYLTDAFCDAARARSLSVVVQPSRHIVVTAPKGTYVVVPLVGVPNALRLHEVEIELASSNSRGPFGTWALYDERGLLTGILEHLDWLNDSLPLEAVSVFSVATRLDQMASP